MKFSLLNFLAQYVDPVPYNSGTPTPTPPPTPQPSYNFVPIIIAFIVLIAGTSIAALGFLIFAKKKREEDRTDKSLNGKLYRIRISQHNEIEIGVAEQLFSNLYSIGKPLKGFKKFFNVNDAISLEIVGFSTSIDFFVYAPKKFAKLVEDQVLGVYQGAEIEDVSEYNIFSENKSVAVAKLELSEEPYAPVKGYEDFKQNSMSVILTSFSKLSEGESAALQIVISPAGSKWQKNGSKYVEGINSNNSDPEKKRKEVSQEKLSAIEKKCNKNGFFTEIRIVAVGNTKEIAEERVNGIAGSFDQFANPGINYFKKVTPKDSELKEFMKNFIYRKGPSNKKNVLNVTELAAIYHLPNKDVQIPLINWLPFKTAPVDPRIPEEGTWLGTSTYRGVQRPIAIDEDSRRRHMYVVGQTGTGKSYFIQGLALQDIYNGHGVCFIDPHGDTIEWILERIPPDRVEDVIYFNPADRERPVGFNMLEAYNESDKTLVINSFLGLMHKMFDPNNQGIVGPIFERSVRNAMLTVMTEEGSTLVEVVRVITDENWVKDYWVPKIKDDMVRRFWTDQMAQTDKFHKSEALGYLVSKFDRFVTDELMRNIIGQSKSGFDFREVMDNQKILLFNLSKGLIGEEASQFLGLILIPRLLRAAMSRAEIPFDQRKDFYLYVDEFQNYATDSFAQILSEARKYKLNLIVANQYISQMDQKIRDAVFGNVGGVVSFRVGADDAEYLEKIFEPTFDRNDLINIANINAYSRLLVKNEVPPAFSMSTKYDLSKWPPNKESMRLAKELSRTKYGRDVDTIRQEINQRAQLAVENAPPAQTNLPTPPLF